MKKTLRSLATKIVDLELQAASMRKDPLAPILLDSRDVLIDRLLEFLTYISHSDAWMISSIKHAFKGDV